MLIPTDRHNPEAITYAIPALLGERSGVELLEQHVRNLPRLEAVFICAKLNLVSSEAAFRGFNTFAVQAQMLKDLTALDWISPFDLPRLEATNHPPNLQVLVGRQSLFELIRWLILWDGPVVDKTKQRMSLIRALLQSSDLATKRQGEFNLDEFKSLSNRERMFALLPLFRELTLWQTPTYDPKFQFGRSQSLFLDCFLSSNSNYVSRLENEFQMEIREYLACIIAAASIAENWFPHNQMPRLRSDLEIDLANGQEALLPAMSNKFAKFLALESQTIDQLREKLKKTYGDTGTWLELRPFRDCPILTDGASRAVVLDQTLLCERGSSGLIFRIAKHDEGVFSQFGYAFERYVQKIFDKYISDVNQHHSQPQQRLKGWGPVFNDGNKTDEFSDYIVFEGDVAIVVETKTGLIKDSLVRKTPEELWSELMVRYGAVKTKSKPGSKNKGLTQLANSIRKWVDKESRVLNSDGLTTSAKTIIPLLVVFDAHLPILGYTNFLAEEFKRKFANDAAGKPIIEYKGAKILSLCIMSIDQFELFEGNILQKTLVDLVLQYSNDYPERDVAFGQYLSHYQPENVTQDSAIIASSREAIHDALYTLFGRRMYLP